MVTVAVQRRLWQRWRRPTYPGAHVNVRLAWVCVCVCISLVNNAPKCSNFLLLLSFHHSDSFIPSISIPFSPIAIHFYCVTKRIDFLSIYSYLYLCYASAKRNKERDNFCEHGYSNSNIVDDGVQKEVRWIDRRERENYSRTTMNRNHQHAHFWVCFFFLVSVVAFAECPCCHYTTVASSMCVHTMTMCYVLYI